MLKHQAINLPQWFEEGLLGLKNEDMAECEWKERLDVLQQQWVQELSNQSSAKYLYHVDLQQSCHMPGTNMLAPASGPIFNPPGHRTAALAPRVLVYTNTLMTLLKALQIQIVALPKKVNTPYRNAC